MPPPGYAKALREICDRHGVLLCCDEVITGFGRLGEWFGSTRLGFAPDIITFAKGMTSGYAPLGGVLFSDAIAEPLLETKGAVHATATRSAATRSRARSRSRTSTIMDALRRDRERARHRGATSSRG